MRLTRPLLSLTLAAGLLTGIAPVAFAQDGEPRLTASPDEEKAEFAFLRAYYQEVGLADLETAVTRYGELLERFPTARGVVGKALLGQLRCLRTLGRRAEADAVFARIEKEFADDSQLLAAALAARAPDEQDDPVDKELRKLVRKAFWSNGWQVEIPRFGDAAISILAESMRDPDPDMVERAATALVAIGSDRACDTVFAALSDRKVILGQRVEDGLSRTARVPDRLGTKIVQMADTERRNRLLIRLNSPGQRWLVDAAEEHAWLRTLLLERKHSTRAWLAVELGARGPGAARDDAVAFLERFDANQNWASGFLTALRNPPAAALADPELLSVLAGLLPPDPTRVSNQEWPASAFRAALLASPEHRGRGLVWTLNAWNVTKAGTAHRGNMMAAIGDRSASGTLALTQTQIRVLQTLLAPAPTPEEWRQLAIGLKEHSLDDIFLSTWFRGGIDAASWQALAETVTAQQATTIMSELYSNVKSARDPAPVATFTIQLARRFKDVRPYAMAVLESLQQGGADLSAHSAELLAFLDASGDKKLIAIIASLDADARTALVERATLGGKSTRAILDALSARNAPERIVAARQILAASLGDRTAENDADITKTIAANLLVLDQRKASVQVLEGALAVEDGRWARDVASGLDYGPAYLGAEGFEQLCSVVLRDHPGAVSLLDDMHDAFNDLDAEARRRLALVALNAKHARSWRWGAQLEAELADPAATERLTELASAADPTTRGWAFSALAAIDKLETRLATLQGRQARRSLLARAEGLLAQDGVQSRLAGVAALASLGTPDAAMRLLQVAESDPNPPVAEEARRVLVTIGQAWREEDGTRKDK